MTGLQTGSNAIAASNVSALRMSLNWTQVSAHIDVSLQRMTDLQAGSNAIVAI